eukprot:gene27294-32966_t
MLSILSHSFRLSTHSPFRSFSSRTLRVKSVTDTREHNDNLKLIPYNVLSFYKFHKLEEKEIESLLVSIPAQLKTETWTPLRDLRGTLMVANEGINGQFALTPESIPIFKSLLTSVHPALFGEVYFNVHTPHILTHPKHSSFPYKRLIIRRKKEVLTTIPTRDEYGMEVSEPAPAEAELLKSLDWSDAGPELAPADWHQALLKIQKEGTKGVVLDCRNEYETSFQGAIPLRTQKFSETFEKLPELLEQRKVDKNTPIYTFCTGGIRCVKVNAYLKAKGYNNIHRLQNGIVEYERWAQDQNMAKNIGSDCASDDEKTSLFKGENFVFDRRRLEV